MKKETKQTLISLSLAGAIGYYLYNKLVQAGMSSKVEQGSKETAAEKTKRELSWRPEPVIEEPILDETIEETQEEIIETTNVDEAIPAEESVDEEVIEQPVDDADAAQAEEEKVAENRVYCTSCGGANPDGNVVCEFCGTSLITDENESKVEALDEGEENVVDQDESDVLVTPTLDFENLNFGEAEKTENAEAVSNESVESESAVDEISIEAILDAGNLNENDEETSVEDLFSAVQEDEPQEPEEKEKEETIMENVEPLHKVDQKSESAKKEFKSIMDFFKTL